MKSLIRFRIGLLAFGIALWFALSATGKAQLGTWTDQPLPPLSGYLYDIDMFDKFWGFAVGVADSANNYSGIMITLDGGTNWIPMPNDTMMFFPPVPPWCVWRAVSYADGNHIIVVGDSGLIYRSTNFGAEWRKVRSNVGTTTLRDVHFDQTGMGIAVGGDGIGGLTPPPPTGPKPPVILRSLDWGGGWSDESPPPSGSGADPAYYKVEESQGEWVVTGERSTYLRYVGGLWVVQAKPMSKPNDLLSALSMINGTEIVIGGTTFSPPIGPVVYRNLPSQPTRFVNITPNGIGAISPNVRAVDFLNTNLGWVGVSQSYLGVTTDGGSTYKQFRVDPLGGSGTCNAIEFVDSLNGWAVGGFDPPGSPGIGWVARYYGVPPEPEIRFSSTAAVFSTIKCERFIDTSFLIQNSGTGMLVIEAGGISTSSSEVTILDAQYPMKIQPGKTRKIRIRWTPPPGYSGPFTGDITVTSNDPNDNPWLISLSGMRLRAVLDFPSEITFYSGLCVGTRTEETITASPSGNINPTFIDWQFVSGHNEFTLLSPAKGIVINKLQDFRFRFAPTQIGLRTAQFRLISGSPECPDTMIVTMRGQGERTRITPSLTTIDFGELCVGKFRDTVITLTNTGTIDSYIGVREYVSGPDMFPLVVTSPTYIRKDSVKTYRLRFEPLASGDFTATYRIANDPCVDTIVFTLKGKGLTTEITALPPTVVLGPTIVGKPVSTNVTIRNSGKTDAFITEIRLRYGGIDLKMTNSNPMPLTLVPTQTAQVQVEFEPLVVGEVRADIIVRWNGRCADSLIIPIEAICVPNPHIEVASAMDVGEQLCPTPIRDTIFIHNTGNGPLVFTSTTMVGLTPTHFTVIRPQTDDTVRARDSLRLIIEYNSLIEGPSSATLFLNHNDAERMPTSIFLTGRRKIHNFRVDGDSLTEFFTRLFVPERRTFKVVNTSNYPITYSGVRAAVSLGVYAVQTITPIPTTLQPGGEASFEVIFTPNARGPFEGVIEVETLPCNTTVALGLVGRGDTEGLSVDKGEIDRTLDACRFATTCDTVLLANFGNEPVRVTGVSITQTGATFSYTAPGAPFFVNPTQVVPVIVCMDPAVFGLSTGTLVIDSDDPVYPQLTIQLKARRDSSNIAVDVSEMDFGRLAQCESAQPRKVRVTNTGTMNEAINVRLPSGVAFTTSAPNQFSLIPGATAEFDVTFTRPSVAAFLDTLAFISQRCGTEREVILKGEWYEQHYTVGPPTLSYGDLSISLASTKSLSITNNGPVNGTIVSVTIQPPAGFTVLPGHATTLTPGSPETIQIRFEPTSEQNYNAQACIIIDSPCPDTLCISLDGRGVKGNITLRPSALDFGTMQQCEQKVLSDTLKNEGTGPITILDATVLDGGTNMFANLTPVAPSGETLLPGQERVFSIRFTPATPPNDGPISAELRIQTDDPQFPTVTLPLHAIKETFVASAGAPVDFGNTQLSNQYPRQATLTNNGTARLCYNTWSLPPGITVTPALPICLDPGASQDITITFEPQAEGAFNGVFTLYAPGPCSDSTVFTLVSLVGQGSITQTANADLPRDAWCLVRTLTVEIVNTHLDPVTVDSVLITGGDAAFFAVTSPSLPQTVASGGTLTVTITFSGVNADRNYAALLTSYMRLRESLQLRQTQLSAVGAAVSITANALAFGQVVTNQSSGNQLVTIRNTSQIPISISAVTPSNAAFIPGVIIPSLPTTVQPGGTVAVEIRFAPTTTGMYSDSLVITSDGPCPFTYGSRLDGEAIPRSITNVALSIGEFSAPVDSRIVIPIIMDASLQGSEVASWSGSLSYNRTMLHPVGIVKEGTASEPMSVTWTPDAVNGVCSLNATGGPITSSGRTLVGVEFLVLVGNSVNTGIDFSANFDFTSGYAKVMSRANGNFTLTGYCQPATRLLGATLGFALKQNRPNPISTSVSPVTTVEFTVPADGYVELNLFDATGRMRKQLAAQTLGAGTYNISVSLQGLQSGVYYYTLLSGGRSATKKLLIVD